MKAKEAIAIFKSRCPDFKVTGYWEDGDNIIVNTAPLYNKEAEEVCQFIVFSNGIKLFIVFTILLYSFCIELKS